MDDIDNIAMLHRSKNKASAYQDGEGFWWSEKNKKWICFNSEVTKLILNDSDFKVVSHELVKITERFSLDLDHVINMVKFLPVTLDDEAHKVIRKRHALLIAENTEIALSNFEIGFQSKLNFLLAKRNSFDWIQDLIKPLIHQTIIQLAAIELDDTHPIEWLSTVFDETQSLKNRGYLNKAVGQIFNQLRTNMPPDEAYFKIALLALGNDSIISTIGETTLNILSKNHAKRLSEIEWNTDFIATGVPVIERVAVKDKLVTGLTVRKNQRVRIFLDAAGYQAVSCPHFSKLYFGSGPHLCLGMAISKKIWTIIIRELSKVERYLCVLDFAYKENDQVFNLLDKLKVEWND